MTMCLFSALVIFFD
jgi:uncharacterized protein YidB (DUF937 family)